MNKKDALELKRRFTKESSVSRLAGCYVDCNKNVVLRFNENFLNLAEEEFYKYLEIARKTLSGNIGNNILEHEFPGNEEETGGIQEYLLQVKSSDFKDDSCLDRLYQTIIEKYSFPGNYLILVFKDTYDVMTRTKDGIDVDESEEVFEYILVSICPVELAKPALGYRTDENRIGARIRDWVVGNPDTGFLFPAFDNRSADIHKVDFFIRDPKEPHNEFIEEVLGCNPRRTSFVQRSVFAGIVKQAYRDDSEKAESMLLEIEDSFKLMTSGNGEEEQEGEPILLTEQVIDTVLEENDVEEVPAGIIRKICRDEFSDELPAVENLVDERALKAYAPVKRERELVKEVIGLQNRIKELDGADSGYDVVLKMSKERAGEVFCDIINDRRYILIPCEENEQVSVNGELLQE